jgi:hypothetical protein
VHPLATGVADIYFTEFDRIFRHFYSCDGADEVAQRGGQSKALFLDLTGAWSREYFESEEFNSHRRQIFIAVPHSNWAAKAPSDAGPFANQQSPEHEKPERRIQRRRQNRAEKNPEKEEDQPLEAYSHSSWAQKQNAMIERAGKKNHREDEPITKMQIGSSSRLIVDKEPSQLL